MYFDEGQIKSPFYESSFIAEEISFCIS